MTTELVARTFAICHTILKASYPGTPIPPLSISVVNELLQDVRLVLSYFHTIISDKVFRIFVIQNKLQL